MTIPFSNLMGLAGGSALLMFVGTAIVAWDAGDTRVLGQAAAMTGALVGFLLWSYPKGKVFLGDAGAYFIGFTYAQLSIQLVARCANPRVAPRLQLHGVLCFVTTLAFYDNTLVLIGFTLIYGIYYIVCYRNAERLSGDIMTRQTDAFCERLSTYNTSKSTPAAC